MGEGWWSRDKACVCRLRGALWLLTGRKLSKEQCRLCSCVVNMWEVYHRMPFFFLATSQPLILLCYLPPPGTAQSLTDILSLPLTLWRLSEDVFLRSIAFKDRKVIWYGNYRLQKMAMPCEAELLRTDIKWERERWLYYLMSDLYEQQLKLFL